MTTLPTYNILVPRIDRTGPCNVAIDIGNEAASCGFRVQLLYLSPSSTARTDLGAFAEVRRFRVTDFFQLHGVLHTHCLRPDIIGGLISNLGRCKTITTLHNYFKIDLGFDHSPWKVKLSWLAWKWAIRQTDHVACISKSMLRYYAREIPSAKLKLAYNFRGYPEKLLSTLPKESSEWCLHQRQNGRIILAFVGGLNPRKNVARLLKAIESSPDLSLLCCGSGVEMEKLLEILKENPSLAERVLMVGQTQNPVAYITAADMLVLPSMAEGLPLVVIEAARAGRPCLLSNIAVHRELAALGLGRTFDRKRFLNFSEQARAIARSHTATSEKFLKNIWQSRFSPGAGFKPYRAMILGSKTPSSIPSSTN